MEILLNSTNSIFSKKTQKTLAILDKSEDIQPKNISEFINHGTCIFRRLKEL